MSFSSYQVEQLISRFKRWLAGPFPKRVHNADRVSLTPAAGEESGGSARHRGGAGAGRLSVVRAIAEKRPFPPGVEAERERRAGSFMHPPYPESPEEIGILPIPKLRRKAPPGDGRAYRGDAD